jgi:hypothetical protein
MWRKEITMRRLWLAALGLCLAPLLSAAVAAGGLDTPADKATCGSHGTTIDFVDTPSEAARQAKKAEKLVFVLHVSGNFEDPRFT